MAPSGAESREVLEQRKAEAAQAVAAVRQLDARIEQKRVQAPFAGQIGIRRVNVGQYLNAGEPVATLTQLDPLYVNFTLPQQDLPRLAPGATVQVSVDAVPGRVFEARVSSIEPRVDSQTRNATVQALLPNPDHVLQSGMYATAALVLPATESAVVLPLTAIQTSASGDSVVLVRDANAQGVGKAVAVPVTTGRRLGEEVLVTQGIQAGDLVVTAGQNRLPPGAVVRIKGADATASPRRARQRGSRHELHRHLHPPAHSGAGGQPADPADGRGAVFSLPVRQYPYLENATVTVTTSFPGATQEVMQGFVTTPISQSIATASGIEYLSSTTTQGKSEIKARLVLNADADRAMTEILAKVQQVKYQLPAGVTDPVISKSTEGGTAVQYVAFFSDTLTIPQITDFANRVAQPLFAGIPGVASVDINGGQTLALRIWIDPVKLAARGLSAGEVAAALRANNVQAAPGQLKSSLTVTNISAATDLRDVEDFRQMVILSKPDGGVVRLSDVATVKSAARTTTTRPSRPACRRSSCRCIPRRKAIRWRSSSRPRRWCRRSARWRRRD